MFRPITSLLFALLCSCSFAQEAFPFKEAEFQGASGARRGEHFEYFMFKRGVVPAGASDQDQAAIMAEWKQRHPDATLVPVSVIGEKSAMPIVYGLAVDGDEYLNVLLVRRGIYPALTMLDPADPTALLQASFNAGYARALGRQERVGNPAGMPSRRLIEAPAYASYVQLLIAAETAAQADAIGIWSERFAAMRDKTGLKPLSATPLSLAQIIGQ